MSRKSSLTVWAETITRDVLSSNDADKIQSYVNNSRKTMEHLLSEMRSAEINLARLQSDIDYCNEFSLKATNEIEFKRLVKAMKYNTYHYNRTSKRINQLRKEYFAYCETLLQIYSVRNDIT